jgi:hypothetical protein
MDEWKQTGRIRITPFLKPSAAPPDDSDLWMGGEASVGTQAGRHIRQSERSRPGLPLTILGLTFLGGLALGTVISSILRKTSR